MGGLSAIWDGSGVEKNRGASHWAQIHVGMGMGMGMGMSMRNEQVLVLGT